MLKHKIITDINEFKALKGVWPKSDIFTSHEWLFNWYLSFGKADQLFIITLYRDQKLCAIFPFMIKKERFKKLQFIGHESSDYLDFMILSLDRENCLLKMFEVLKENKSSWDYIDLIFLRSDSPNLPFLAARSMMKKVDRSLGLDLKGARDIEDFMAGLGSSTRYDLRRKKKRLYNAGQVNFEIVRGRDAIEPLLGRFFELLADRWDGFVNDERRDFYKRMAGDERLEFATLKLKEDVLAMHFGFAQDGCYYYYTPAFNKEFSWFSPGKMLVFHLLEEALKRGMKKFDLLRGGESYKYLWTKNELDLYRFFMVNNSLKGHLVSAISSLKDYVRSKDSLRGLARRLAGKKEPVCS
ncbi:MAG: GNAT family N-acetyltransferase [Candidatus Margulisiibacteriota bacterium]